MNEREYIKRIEALVEQYGDAIQGRARRAAILALEYHRAGMEPELAVSKAFTEAGLTGMQFDTLRELCRQAAGIGASMLVGAPVVFSKTDFSIMWKPVAPLSETLHGGRAALQHDVSESLRAALRDKDTWTATSRRLFDGYKYGHIIPEAELPKYLDELQSAARRLLSNASPAASSSVRPSIW